jgi:hypothetical protein
MELDLPACSIMLNQLLYRLRMRNSYVIRDGMKLSVCAAHLCTLCCFHTTVVFMCMRNAVFESLPPEHIDITSVIYISRCFPLMVSKSS